MNFNASQIVRTSAGLSLPPIASCFTDKVPAGIRNWTGGVPAGYRFCQEAATEVFATSPSDHDLCAIGTFTHNLETTEAHDIDRRDALRVLADLGYVREQDIASIPVLESRSPYVVYGPLASTPLTPDVLLPFAKADQPAQLFRRRLTPVERRREDVEAGKNPTIKESLAAMASRN